VTIVQIFDDVILQRRDSFSKDADHPLNAGSSCRRESVRGRFRRQGLGAGGRGPQSIARASILNRIGLVLSSLRLARYATAGLAPVWGLAKLMSFYVFFDCSSEDPSFGLKLA
jgi:hypothetical protein